MRELYFWGSNEPNFSVDVTDVMETKVEALQKHESQFGDRGTEFAEMVRKRWQDEDGRYYERFSRVILPF